MSNAIQKYIYISLAIIFFGCGIYAWKILNTGLYIPQDSGSDPAAGFSKIRNLLYVGDQSITQDDIDWELDLHIQGLVDKENLTPIPEVEMNPEFLKPLRERVIADLVERKLLYQFVAKDLDFNLEDPARYTDCLALWQESLQEGLEFFESRDGRERLKNLLCEKDLVVQYLQEQVFSRIVIKEDEIESYYKENQEQFEQPLRVVIRQIVLASEKEAKQVRARIRSYNFSNLAKEYSITPEAENGGRLGPFAKGEMPPVFDVAFGMRRNEVRGILKSTYGFHMIKLEKKIPAKKLSLEEARSKIVETLKRQKQEEEYRKWVELALNEISVKTPHPI